MAGNEERRGGGGDSWRVMAGMEDARVGRYRGALRATDPDRRPWGDRTRGGGEGEGPDGGPHRGRGPKGYRRADARVLEDVGDRLSEDPGLDASGIDLAVADGEVTLGGVVADRAARRRAEDLAAAVPGVRQVLNHLRVG